MMISWNNLTVEQFQGIYGLHKSRPKDDIDFANSIVFFLSGRDEMPMSEYRKWLKSGLSFLNFKEIPGRPKNYIKAGGKWFKANYNVQDEAFGQYIDQVSFAKGEDYLIRNLDSLAAAIFVPCKGLFRKPMKYNGEKHAKVAETLRKAKFIDVYHSVVFFWAYYRNSMGSLKGFLAEELKKKGVEGEAGLQALMRYLDGCTPSNRWRILNESQLARLRS